MVCLALDVKGGLVGRGEFVEGVPRLVGWSEGSCNITGASFGPHAGLQGVSSVLRIMNDSAEPLWTAAMAGQ